MLDFPPILRIFAVMSLCKNHKAPRRVTIGAISAELLPRAAYDVAYTPDRTVAGFAFDIQTGDHAFASDSVRPFVTVPGTLALTPKGCDIRSRSETGGEYLTVKLTPGAEHTVIGDAVERAPRQVSNAAHQGARHYARALRSALLNPDADPAAIESAAALLYEAAWQARKPSGKPASSITPRRLRVLNDLVEARFSERLTVADMAGVLGLSISFFVRAFAAATGTTPHAYLLERRLGEARRVLSANRETIASVALGCGFSSQAHMTSSFQKALGVTPKRYRDLTA